MAWPTGSISTEHLDNDADSPLSARPSLKQTVDQVNEMRDNGEPAQKGGNATQRFKVADAQANDEAINRSQGDGRYPPVGRIITAGNGLTGGGDLSANRTVTMGTPGTLSGNSSNQVTTSSHTHNINVATQAQAEAGTDNINLMTSLRVRQAVDARAAFTLSYESAPQTIERSGSRTLEHGLGGFPSLVQVWLLCTEAEHGYSVGDRLIMPFLNVSAGSKGVAVITDTTNIFLRYGENATSVFDGLRKTDGLQFTFNNDRWRVIVKAWR